MHIWLAEKQYCTEKGKLKKRVVYEYIYKVFIGLTFRLVDGIITHAQCYHSTQEMKAILFASCSSERAVSDPRPLGNTILPVRPKIITREAQPLFVFTPVAISIASHQRVNCNTIGNAKGMKFDISVYKKI